MKLKILTALTLSFFFVTSLFIVASGHFVRDPINPEPVGTPPPFSTETDMLILRGTKATSGTDTVHHLLIDEDTPYPNQNRLLSYGQSGFRCNREDIETVNTKILGAFQQLYKETFIYERNPPEGYIISGMPAVSLTFNVSRTKLEQTYFTLGFYANLYKYSTLDPETSWEMIVQFDDYTHTYYLSALMIYDVQENIWFGTSLNEPIYIASHERLALQVMVMGSYPSPGANMQLEFLHTMNTDEFLVNIPIQYEG